MSSAYTVVMVTHPEEAGARRLALDLIEAGLAACVQRLPVASTFCWEQKVCEESEWLLLIKTPSGRVPALQDFVLARHPYEVPEFLVLPVTGGAPAYLEWLDNACRRLPPGCRDVTS